MEERLQTITTTLQERKATSEGLGIIFIYMIISHQLPYTYLYTTGTQIIQVLNVFYFFFFSFNLTCMLKKSQSWGLSSSLADKRLLAWTNGGLRPRRRIYIWTERKRFKPLAALSNVPKLLRNVDATETSCLLYHGFFFQEEKHRILFPVAGQHLSSNASWPRTSCSRCQSAFQNFSVYTLWPFKHGWQDRFVASFSRRQTLREPFDAASLLLTEKKKKASFLCVQRHSADSWRAL